MVLSGEPKCTGTNSQSSGWGVTKAYVSSTLGTCGPRVRPSFPWAKCHIRLSLLLSTP